MQEQLTAQRTGKGNKDNLGRTEDVPAVATTLMKGDVDTYRFHEDNDLDKPILSDQANILIIVSYKTQWEIQLLYYYVVFEIVSRLHEVSDGGNGC